MTHDAPAYGLWLLVAANSVVFIIFALSFGKPQSPRDWRSFGMFSAFIVALFAEMYGFPLSIFLMSGWLQTRYPGLDLMSHDSGHLWSTLFGISGNLHFSVTHILSFFAIGGGFILLSSAWPVLLAAQKQGRLATTGVYGRVRHPQYMGFIIIMFGFLLQWPTILTLLMFPALLAMYVHLAHTEEAEARLKFGQAYERYASSVAGWFPHLQSRGSPSGTAG
jgi:protein-S-isoprenylcysteine O-methyltransferase Ste14